MGDVDVSSATEIVLTFPAGGGAGNINYYLVLQLLTTLNFSELLPPHRTASRCLQPCAQPRALGLARFLHIWALLKLINNSRTTKACQKIPLVHSAH